MIDTLRLKIVLLLASHGRATVAFLLVLALASGAVAGVAYVEHDDTFTTTERQNVQTARLSATDSALVTNDTVLWDAGTRLTNHPAYLTDVSPNLAIRTTADPPPNANATARTALVVETTVDGERFWTDTRTLGTKKSVDKERFVAANTVAIPELVDRLQRVRSATGDGVSVSVRLRVELQYENERYSGRLVTSAPLTIDGTTYRVGTFDSTSTTHYQTVTHRRERSGFTPPRLSLVGGSVALLALLAGIFAAVGARRLDDPDQVRREIERARLAEWISEGSVPLDDLGTTVSMASLTDLVDVAIDADRRVVYDASHDIYVVIDGDVAFTYAEGETDPPWGGFDFESVEGEGRGGQ